MPNTYLLHAFFLGVLQLVHVPVYLLQAHVILEMAPEIVYGSFLAHRLTDTTNNQMAQLLILNSIETYAIIHLSDNRLGCCKACGFDAG